MHMKSFRKSTYNKKSFRKVLEKVLIIKKIKNYIKDNIRE